ncbi:MAG: glycosyltransferase family 2 protein [Flavobacterium sp.]|uniref:glycosyltransferase family 2 protein n=1 Tax=Flavobacterium sp. TaxID=239 RepID=UPI001B1F8BD5|nr:glycosyltransferase family 2 protein [Flavobacterium sp.]MBO9584152.1 glycosyltransferase family 2 protein [Flavobacterium sp.]
MNIKNNTIAVLITCHNRKDKTLQCLQGLYKQKDLNDKFVIEIFLVDDASTDGTAEAIKSQFSSVNIIKGSGNLYWNRGMCLAWKTAAAHKDFDYYLWLNDDTFLFNSAIADLLQAANETNHSSAIIGSTISAKEKRISYGGNSKEGNLLIPNGKIQEVYSFNGNVVLIPDYVFKIVGFLDKRFPHAIGDFDYGLQIKKNNLSSFITSNFIGSCERNDKLPDWCSVNVPIARRIKNLYSPLGNSHPYYYFIFENKNYGLIRACKHFCTIHIRLLFPQLWLQNN